MPIILYQHEAGSTCSQKVELCLKYKKLEYASINIDLREKQNQSPDYLKINRHGVVPALAHNDQVIHESTLINEYLDRTFTAQPLLPTDPMHIYQVQYLCKRQEYLHEQCFRYLSYAHSGRANTLSDALIQNHPLIDRRPFLRTMKATLPDNDIYEIESYIVNELKHLNSLLSTHQFLCEEQYTLADIAWTATIYRLEQLGNLHMLTDATLTYLLKWYDRMRSMDNFRPYSF